LRDWFCSSSTEETTLTCFDLRTMHSLLYIQLMSLLVSLTEVDKARAAGERALRAISFRYVVVFHHVFGKKMEAK